MYLSSTKIKVIFLVCYLLVIAMSLKKNLRVRIRKVMHGSPKLPVKFTEGMDGRIVGFKKLGFA